MKIFYLISIIAVLIAAILFVIIYLYRTKPNEKFVRIINIFGLVCGFLSMIALIISYVVSPNREISQLFKLGLPLLIVALFFIN